MRPLRRLGFTFLLLFALVANERAALLHELGHGFQRIHAPSQDKTPANDVCDKCFAYSQLSGPAPGALAMVVFAIAAIVLSRFAIIPAPSRTVVATRSRAPPATL